VKQVLAFGIVMAVLFASFALMFNVILTTAIPDYGTFVGTVLELTLDGLMGNMDSAAILTGAPVMGPFMYGAFLFVVPSPCLKPAPHFAPSPSPVGGLRGVHHPYCHHQ
jgi:hypothetical protein